MKTGFFAFFVMLAIVFSYEVAFGSEQITATDNEVNSRESAENELQTQVRKEEDANRSTANADVNESMPRESATAIKGRY